MDKQEPKENRTGKRARKGPLAIQAGSGQCGEGTVPKTLPEDKEISEVHRQHFRQLGYQEADGPCKVCSRLHQLCNCWLEPDRHTNQQLLDLLVLEPFLSLLPQEMQGWVRGCEPETSSQTVALTEGLLSQAEEERQTEQTLGPSFSESEKALWEECQKVQAKQRPQDALSHESRNVREITVKTQESLASEERQESLSRGSEESVSFLSEVAASEGKGESETEDEELNKESVETMQNPLVEGNSRNQHEQKQQQSRKTAPKQKKRATSSVTQCKNLDEILVLSKTEKEMRKYKSCLCGKSFHVRSKQQEHQRRETI